MEVLADDTADKSKAPEPSSSCLRIFSCLSWPWMFSSLELPWSTPPRKKYYNKPCLSVFFVNFYSIYVEIHYVNISIYFLLHGADKFRYPHPIFRLYYPLFTSSSVSRAITSSSFAGMSITLTFESSAESIACLPLTLFFSLSSFIPRLPILAQIRSLM